MLGLLKASTRIDVVVDKKGGLEEVTRIINKQGCEVISVAIESHSSRRKVHYFRLEKCDPTPVVDALEKAGHKVVSVME